MSSHRIRISTHMFIGSFIVFYSWWCAGHRFHLPRHFFTHNFEDHLVLYDKSNCTQPLTFDIRLRHVWGQHRLVIVDSLSREKVLYKLICQTKDYCRILGWTRNQTNVIVLAAINTMAWYPYPTQTDPEFYTEESHDDADYIMKSNILLKQSLLISTDLFDEIFNVTFLPSQRKYTIAYGTQHIVAEVENFDRSTPKNYKENYSLQIFQDVDPKIHPAFLISICISIDYIEWPYYLSST